jgi:hypothetical protein
MIGRLLGLWPAQMSGNRRDDRGKSRVVLVHGLGGSGNSRLLKQFQAMADGALPDSPVPPCQCRTAWLDWEDKQRDQPDSYASAEVRTW